MALLAEEIVEEWLRRQGYFTMRGIKIGVSEIDLLAIRRLEDGTTECRHLEVQASVRPVSYISKVPKAIQKTGKAAGSAARTESELIEGVAEWVEKKFQAPKKHALMKTLWDGEWSAELVLNKFKSPQEVDLIRGHGIEIIQLDDVLKELRGDWVFATSGADLVDLVSLN